MPALNSGSISVGARFRQLLAYRELVANLTARDLKLRYKRSVLGVAWSFLNPILMMAIYTIVFSLLLRAVKAENYWALVLSGVLTWTFFSNSLVSASAAFVRNPNLITKVAFPLEALPISAVLAQFVNFLITLGLLLVILVGGGIHLGPSLLLLPVVVVSQLAFTLGLAILLASVTVHLRDLEHLVGIGLTALFYVSPVLYPLDAAALPASAARFLPWLRLNPVAWYLDNYHSILYYGTWPDPTMLGLSVTAGIVVLGGSYLVFNRLRPRLPESI